MENEIKLSIIAVSYHSPDWEKVLRKSVEKFTDCKHEVIIANNDIDNRGHGPALDEAMLHASGEYVMVLDIDAHIMDSGWDQKMMSMMRARGCDMLAAEGSQLKPVRPAAMMVRREAFIEKRLLFRAVELEGVKFDVGIHAYFRMLSEGMKVGLLKWTKTSYVGVWGDEYSLNGVPTFYHNWYGTRFLNGKVKMVDGRSYEEYERGKKRLFEQLTLKGLWEPKSTT